MSTLLFESTSPILHAHRQLPENFVENPRKMFSTATQPVMFVFYSTGSIYCHPLNLLSDSFIVQVIQSSSIMICFNCSLNLFISYRIKYTGNRKLMDTNKVEHSFPQTILHLETSKFEASNKYFQYHTPKLISPRHNDLRERSNASLRSIHFATN